MVRKPQVGIDRSITQIVTSARGSQFCLAFRLQTSTFWATLRHLACAICSYLWLFNWLLAIRYRLLAGWVRTSITQVVQDMGTLFGFPPLSCISRISWFLRVL